jgi:hypothetical protein
MFIASKSILIVYCISHNSSSKKGYGFFSPVLRNTSSPLDLIGAFLVILHRPEDIRGHLEFGLILVIVRAGFPVYKVILSNIITIILALATVSHTVF